MNALTAGDYQKVLAAIERLDDADDYAGFPHRALSAVATVTDVDFASYAEVDLATGWNRFVIDPALDDVEANTSAYRRFTRRFGNHPILAHQLATRSPADPDTFVQRLRLLGMVGNCCGEAQLLLNVDLALASTDRRLVGISVHRGIRDFESADRERLIALRPHLLTAYRVAWRLTDHSAVAASGTRMVTGLSLTTRENEVLYWVAMGKTNDEVGDIIGARRLTVKKHLEHIYDKLGVPNRTAAASTYRAQAVAGA